MKIIATVTGLKVAHSTMIIEGREEYAKALLQMLKADKDGFYFTVRDNDIKAELVISIDNICNVEITAMRIKGLTLNDFWFMMTLG